MRAAARTACAVALGTLLLVLGAAPAQAEGYRYWVFWTWDADRPEGAAWSYATEGPGTLRPADGAVLGFRFAVSENSAEADRPRQEADFADVCADTAPREGHKRVALVIDPGTAGDAPPGERPPEPMRACARVPADGTAAEALAATAKPLRYDSSALLCAISGYPETGCGEQVSADEGSGGEGSGAADTTREAEAAGEDATEDDAGDAGVSTFGTVAGVVAVVLLAGAAGWQVRRRRS
ncbi:hypothetical protein JJV70_15405 [Streptomyces sp. JJ66]|uniref:SCO2322 family protein n=1 Tax=Streptomyces sp. JJ66 TaxID=2803843 RepID=UPI001C56ACC1|nr:SCO2322 family protein [Streptomyces sp. JJ66]MBW1603466.1 hypothetical protein [Streptomyces sp. JJ66]